MRARPLTSLIVVLLGGTLLAPAPASADPTQTATIVVTDSTLSIGETSRVTITFGEAVTGFEIGDLTVQSGELSALSSADSGKTWTATLTPSGSVTAPTNAITLANGGVAPAVGDGTGVTSSNNYKVDTQRPTATIVVTDVALATGETSGVTITFSEAVTGFTIADLTAENGTLDNLSTEDSITWRARLTPTAVNDANNVITLANGGVADRAENAGEGTTTSANYVIDLTSPTAGIVVTDTLLKAGKTSLVTITFSEAVIAFTNADLTVPNGTLSAVTSTNNTTWTATLTPTANLTAPTNAITLANASYTDVAGNLGSGATSNSYAIDTRRPTATIVVADTSLKAGETSLVTITFSEAVTGFTNADLTVQSGTLSAVSSTNGGITWTATLTPGTSVTDPTNVITLDNAGVTGSATSNPGAGTTSSNNYAVDTARPTASIVVADTNLKIGETSLVTITFSEAVTGFTNSDLTVANGTLNTVSSTNGGVTWTATLTPTASVTDTTNVISLNLTGVTDAAGNTGVGVAGSNNYAVDTARPTATVVLADTTLAAGATSLVTITFSEPVTGFTNTDLSLPNGTLSAVASTTGGTTWTATLTAPSGITDVTNVISLDLAGVADQAGNAGIGTATSSNYVIDAFAPTSHASGPGLTSTRTWSIAYEATDDSTVASVALYARAPGESTYTQVGSDTAVIDGVFDYTGTADGAYSFYTVATDVVGNTESAPASPDVSTILDTTAPALVARMGRTPVRFDLGRQSSLLLRAHVGERSAVAFKIINADGATVRSFGAQKDVKGLVSQPWNGRQRSGRLVAEGRYRLLVVAQDAAGNEGRVTVPIRVIR